MEQVVHQAKEVGAEVMIATHNQHSVEHAVALMHVLNIDPRDSGIFFGQLLGMSDPLTFVLGSNGYKVRCCNVQRTVHTSDTWLAFSSTCCSSLSELDSQFCIYTDLSWHSTCEWLCHSNACLAVPDPADSGSMQLCCLLAESVSMLRALDMDVFSRR